jgi:hypothetical protein
MPPAFPPQELREKRDGRDGEEFEVFGTSNPELRVTPVAHGLLVSLTFHAQEPRIHACSEACMNNA